MKSILDMMCLSELREYGQLRHELYLEVREIVSKPFLEVTVKELYTLAKTDIFDYHFVDLLFNNLLFRFES